jgi:hypothetical protein
MKKTVANSAGGGNPKTDDAIRLNFAVDRVSWCAGVRYRLPAED